MANNKNNNVMGPYDAADWFTLKQLKKSIAEMQEKKQAKLAIPIRHEQQFYKDWINGKFAA